MTVSAADRELVDREFRPGELPVAEPPPSAIEEPAAWLTTVTTRLAVPPAPSRQVIVIM